MKNHSREVFKARLFLALGMVVALCVAIPTAYGQESAQGQKHPGRLRAYTTVRPAAAADAAKVQSDLAATGKTGMSSLTLFNYSVTSTRDGNTYTGVMVGSNPFAGGGSSETMTYIVPLIFVTHRVGVSFDPTTGAIGTAPGKTTFDPTVPDNACLSAPNNVPLNVFQQSPIFNSASFSFGGTDVGDTQYIDAFMRGNFWDVEDRSAYHLLLGPVKTLDPISINVPDDLGLTLPQSDFPSCGPFGVVDINFLDKKLTNEVLQRLAPKGVNAGNFPIFLMYNVVLASPVTNLNTCCVLGYHGAANSPLQTYSPIDFDSTGLFGPAIGDTYVAGHEVGEWANDPFGNNATPAWGNTGQVMGACQNNLEVGDPLTGTAPITSPASNGFTYRLQELAFFSWFYGAPSIAVNGWFSDNGTFLTDAGPVCH
jgi:hypothetical protein